MTLGGLPYAIEAAFAYRPEEESRSLITGVNFSVGIGNPFRRIGPFQDLSSLLMRRMAGEDEPVVLMLHYTCPRVDYSDRGKSTLALPWEVGEAIKELVEQVTKDWSKQRLAEHRRASAAANREQRLMRRSEKPKKEPAEPNGVLAEKISLAADALGVPIDSLVVLSRDIDPYTAWRRQREAEWFARLFDRLVAPGATKHLRGLFYLLVSSTAITAPDGKPFVNDYKHWQALQSASKAARWLGLVPFERIIDERNAPPKIFVPGVTPTSASVDGRHRYPSQGTLCGAVGCLFRDRRGGTGILIHLRQQRLSDSPLV